MATIVSERHVRTRWPGPDPQMDLVLRFARKPEKRMVAFVGIESATATVAGNSEGYSARKSADSCASSTCAAWGELRDTRILLGAWSVMYEPPFAYRSSVC